MMMNDPAFTRVEAAAHPAPSLSVLVHFENHIESALFAWHRLCAV